MLIAVIEMAFEDEEDESQTLAASETLEDPQSIHILLPEITIEILSRLPVESLLRCKSVCKSWRSLISNPRFVKYHLTLSNSNSEYAHHRLITCPGGASVKWCSLHDVIYDKSINSLELDYPMKHTQKPVWIAGSCNGLLCIVVGDEDDDEDEVDNVFILNPSTRRSNWLPCSGFEDSFFQAYSFGYEEFSDDYKVVSLAFGVFEDGTKTDTMVMIYSLNSGNWKKIGDFPYGIPIFHSGEFSNGALHWLTKTDDSSSFLWIIISLDIATETYGEVLQPVYDGGDKALCLGVLREWLCLVCDYSENRRKDVWVMKDYGVKDSWTKIASIQNLTDSPPARLWESLNIAYDGKIFLHCGKKLVMYDAKNDSSSEIKNYDGALVAWTTVESLVSPDPLR